MLVSPKCDSPTVYPTPETEETLDSQESQQIEPPGLTTLPIELVLLISEQLPLADALCLALACKRMCYITNIGYLAVRLDADATDTLLCRLERDTTELTYCFRRQKLLPAKFTACKPRWLHVHSHIRGNPERTSYFYVNRYMLDYCTARVLTNHQLLGPRHGIPASYFSKTSDYKHLWVEGIRESEVWTAKVIHGELFLSCIHTIFHKAADAGALQRYCNTEHIEACPHTWFGSHLGFRLPRDVIGNTECHFVGWCGKCETDWDVDIECADTERGWAVTITTYHGLGACRSPQDQKWQAFSASSIFGKGHREVNGGAVKELWQQHKS